MRDDDHETVAAADKGNGLPVVDDSDKTRGQVVTQPQGVEQAVRTAGRPPIVSEELKDSLLNQLLGARSMRQVCDQDGMPSRRTVARWLADDEEFAAKYAWVREMQADFMDDLILETAEACTPETAMADRIKIDAYKWRASKLNAKKYGDRTIHSNDADNPMPNTVIVSFHGKD